MTEKDIARFWSKVDKQGPDECWKWLGGNSRRGYGQFFMRGQVFLSAHRAAWEIHHGRRPSLCVLHRCDNPGCVNPAHLFEGTIAENHRDMVAKGRSTCGERNAQATMSNATVLRIAAALSNGERQVAVAHRFNVDIRRIHAIARGHRWGRVTGIRRVS